MKHLALHAIADTLLFHDWIEARALWDLLVATGPPHALVLMPDHVHLIARDPAPLRIRQAMAAWTRWRARERGWEGAVWAPLAPPVTIPDRLHLERTVRYAHLNPCRAGLVADPLAWPMSTHRDALGLAVPLARPVETDRYRFHAYVSGDPTVSTSGTPVPSGNMLLKPGFDDIHRAVSAVTRTAVETLTERGDARTLLIRALRVLTPLTTREIGERLGLSHTTIRKVPDQTCLEVAAVSAVLGDVRFRALKAMDLRSDTRVRQYLLGRAARRLRAGER